MCVCVSLLFGSSSKCRLTIRKFNICTPVNSESLGVRARAVRLFQQGIVGFHVAAAMAVAIAMVMIIFDACSVFGDCHGCVSVCLSVYLCAFPFCSGSERRVDRVLCRLQLHIEKGLGIVMRLEGRLLHQLKPMLMRHRLY